MRANNAPPASDPYGEGYIPDAFTKPPGTFRKTILHSNVGKQNKEIRIPDRAKNRFSTFQNAAEEVISIEDHWQEIKSFHDSLRNITNKDVRNSARRDKKAFVDKLTAEAEEAARANNIKALYDNITLLIGKYQKGRPVKSKEGKTLNTHEDQTKRWVEHFKGCAKPGPTCKKS
ncbi:unnamed protein product [Mytilus edulis]|uniref:Uncharacterized protein n=1 Tax=Mytilus edulis TaxID=6550 RepID=A0A8S3TIE9_MYTED|nr:unnamed protein product [Mytilus edulis]